MNDKEPEAPGFSYGRRPIAGGQEPAGPVSPTITDAILLEEALALALRGRAEDALTLLGIDDDADAAGVPSDTPSAPLTSAAKLAAARILHLRGHDADRERARAILSEMVSEGKDPAWRASLELARAARAEGELEDVASHLQQALRSFREANAASPDTRLAGLIARDVEDLQAASKSAPARSDASPSLGHFAPASLSLGQSAPAALDAATGARSSGPGARTSGDLLDPRALLRLVELGKRLVTEGEPDTVLRIVLHEAIQLTGAQRGFLVLVHGGRSGGEASEREPSDRAGAEFPSDGEVSDRAGAEYPSDGEASDRAGADFKDDAFEFALAENMDRTEVQQPSFEVSRTLIRRALQEGRTVLVSLPEDQAVPGDPTHKSLADIGALSVACVPIAHEGRPLGVLYLDGRDPAHDFGGPVSRLLELFAAQSAAALENARAHRARARALEAARETILRHRTETERRVRYEGLIGASDEMQKVYANIDRMAPTEMPVIILGETGTGKELVARLLHARGPRAKHEFVAMNCAGLPETLLEGELFGHERGAFTGAERTRPGLFELADAGTLFLDEVGDMSPRMQADLLRAVQSGEVRRVGGHETIHVDVRIVAATHRNLEDLVRRGEFRQDLYFRLNVLGLRLPSLRERADDIPLLASELITHLAPQGRTAPKISEGAMRRLVAYRWPGNVRELQNVLRRLCVLGLAVIEEENLPPEITSANLRSDRPGSLRMAEDEAVRRAFEASAGNKTEAARILGVDRKTLYTKLRRLGLDG